MFEVNPYLDVEVFENGVTSENVDAFLGKRGRLSLLIEECDEPYIKLLLRERARDLGIPVLMETSDRGMLDIEAGPPRAPSSLIARTGGS